jgi:hypothetical protein
MSVCGNASLKARQFVTDWLTDLSTAPILDAIVTAILTICSSFHFLH